MLKIKETVVHLLGENIWKWRLQSHLDTSRLLNLTFLWIKQFSIWHPVASKSIGCKS
jgi:hypothetical protein